MTDNLDDFDEDFHNDGSVQRSAPAQKPGLRKNLSAAWQGSPLFKLFVLVVGVGALAAALIGIFSGGNNGKKEMVSVAGAPNISSTPGAPAPPAYNQALQEASDRRAQQALETNKSAVPDLISPDTTNAGLNNPGEESSYDPLNEFRPQTPTDNSTAQQQQQEQAESIDGDLLGKMQSQMTGLFDAWKPEGIRVVQVVDPGSLLKEQSQQPAQAAARGRVIIPAGTVSYGQLMVEANSDAPGPILAEILSGPFSGGKAIGEFEVTRNYLILHFTKVTYRKRDYTADIIALDPNTTLGALVTEKDNRYFTRVVLPAAAGFLEGFGSALSSSSSNTIVTDGGPVIIQNSKQGVTDGIYRGISEGANTVGSFLRDEASATKPLIRVGVGTPMGLFFVNSVTEDNNNGGPIETQVLKNGPQQQNTQFNVPTNSLLTNVPLTNVPGIPGAVSPSPGTVILGGSQSSLANTGLGVIQTTPK